MLRRLLSRTGCAAAVLAVVGVSCLATSCGGENNAAQEMILIQLQFLDRGLVPTQPTGTQSLPRNALVGMVFSERVDPLTVTNQTVPTSAGKIPPAVIPSLGSVNRKSMEITGPPSCTRTARITNTGRISRMVMTRKRTPQRRST